MITSPTKRRPTSLWRTLLAFAAVLLMTTLVGVGCGPTQATILISESEVAFEKAVLVDAEAKAPYEYWSAKQYLHKSKEEWGYSNFEKSAEYATLAQKFSEEALRKAKGVINTPAGPDAAKPDTRRPARGNKKGTFRSSDAEADALENIE